MRAIVALICLMLATPAHAQWDCRWVSNCGDAERKATDAEIAAGIDLNMAAKICGGGPHLWSLNWQGGETRCDAIKARWENEQRERDRKGK